MSQRIYHQPITQGAKHVYQSVQMVSGGSTVSLGEGDPKGAYYAVAKTGTGVYTVKTLDPFVGFVGITGNVLSATDSDAWTITFKKPSQNSDHTWTVEFVTFKAGVATNVTSGDIVSLLLVTRQSQVQP